MSLSFIFELLFCFHFHNCAHHNTQGTEPILFSEDIQNKKRKRNKNSSAKSFTEERASKIYF